MPMTGAIIVKKNPRLDRNNLLLTAAATMIFQRSIVALFLIAILGPGFRNISAAPYEGDLKQADLRVNELKQMIVNGTTLPAAINLRYQGIDHYIYLQFYDIEGNIVFFRFRDDRWDDLAMKKVEQLMEGSAYHVEGSLVGVYFQSQLYDRLDPQLPKILAGKDHWIPVFEFSRATSIRIDQILF